MYLLTSDFFADLLLFLELNCLYLSEEVGFSIGMASMG
jgi:hypothetical protein